MSAQRPEGPPSPSPKPGPQGRRPTEDDSPEQRNRTPNFFIILMVVLAFGMLLNWFSSPALHGTTVPYSFFLKQLEDGNVKTAHIDWPILSGEWGEVPKKQSDEDPEFKPEFNTVVSNLEDRTLLTKLQEKGVKLIEENKTLGLFDQFLFWMLPLVLMMAFFVWMMRRSSDPTASGMFGSFVRSPAKRFQASEQQSTFKDVAGMEHAKRELEEVVEFLKDPEKFQRLGARIPKGVLLMGPPGTGKTLLARATAGEAGVPYFSINGSEFIQMFVGVGASRVRDMFRTAKDAAPSILFIDEIDAVGRVRGAGVGGGHDEREQTLNQILSEMDGFDQSEAVIVIAATNRPDVLDPALLRPGRFDRHVAVEKPTKQGRVGILKVHTRKVPLANDVKLDEVAAGTIGFSGADLRNLVNEAALNATREGKSAVHKDDFEYARDRILMGAKREELINDHEREMTAYHEAGHALLAWLSPEIDLVHKVTIVPRGRALGVTQLLPEEERLSIGEKRLYAMLSFMLGGRAAEKLKFDEYTAGAEDDLKRATDIARRMVAHWGMSEKIGPVAFRQTDEHPFLGKEIHEQRQFSDETARMIDEEIQRLLNEAQERAVETLAQNRDMLDKLSQGLLNDEILDRDEMTALIGPPIERRYKASALQPVVSPTRESSGES
ncbi:MAG: ATP-dependent zinc metalloprotease FtsH [Planctomycetaceae bacterium]